MAHYSDFHPYQDTGVESTGSRLGASNNNAVADYELQDYFDDNGIPVS
jgi:hypothetical protein